MDNSTYSPDRHCDSASAPDSDQSLYYYRTLLDTPPPSNYRTLLDTPPPSNYRTLLDTPPPSSSSTENNPRTPSDHYPDPVQEKSVTPYTPSNRKIRGYTIKGEPDKLTAPLDGEPTHADHDHLNLYAEEILKPISVKGARDRYQLNWLNVAELLANKGCLDRRAQDLLRMFVKSKWDTVSWLENGLKSTNGKLSQALLLLIASEAWHIVPNAYTIVESNFRSKDGMYSPKNCKRRFISPKAACAKIREFKNIFAPEGLFPRHHAYLVLFESPEELRSVGHNPGHRREDYDRFFAQNRQSLKDWKRSGRIRAFYLSHEITCRSILEHTFNPHSHAVIWVDAESDASFIDEFIEAGELIKYRGDPKTDWADLKNFLYYMMRAHSLASVYEREFNTEDPVSFNKATVNVLHSLVQLQCGDGGGQGKQKLYREGIPKRKKM